MRSDSVKWSRQSQALGLTVGLQDIDMGLEKAATDGLPIELSALRGIVPFVLRLRHYSDQAFPNVDDWLKTEFPMLPTPPDGWIRKQHVGGRALVLVDGVDEMPETKRDNMLMALRQLVALYPAALQDWGAWREWIEAVEFTHVAMDPMSDDQRTALVTRWFNEYRKTEYDAERQRRLSGMDSRLNTLIGRSQPLKTLANNPLMCAMACALYEIYGDSLPQRRTELYDKCIEMALSLRDDRRKVAAARDYKVIVDKRPLLQHLAGWMMPMGQAEDEQTSVDKERSIARMDTWIDERKLPGASGTDMCRFYVERASLLREPLVGKIEFEHRIRNTWRRKNYASKIT